MSTMTKVNLFMPVELIDSLKEIATDRHVNFSEFVRAILWCEVERVKREDNKEINNA